MTCFGMMIVLLVARDLDWIRSDGSTFARKRVLDFYISMSSGTYRPPLAFTGAGSAHGQNLAKTRIED